MSPNCELPDSISCVADAEALVDWCIAKVGLGYHPDTPAATYSTDDGTGCFTEAQAERLDQLHDDAFVAGYADAMYKHGLGRFHGIMAG